MATTLEKSSVENLEELKALQEWADDLVNQVAYPREPQLVNPIIRGSSQWDVLRQRSAQNLEFVRRLVRSDHPDLQLSAPLLFDPIIAAVGSAQLREICNEDPVGKRLWIEFEAAAVRFVVHRQEIAYFQGEIEASRSETQEQSGALMTVIVHGTLAAGEDWWRDMGVQRNFWAYINDKTGNCARSGKEFTWSGITDADRRQGAALFLQWWHLEQKPQLRIVAHSHGANVIWHAMALEPSLKIETFISMGTPICIDYPLRLKQVQALRNLYSENDRWQTAGARLTGRRGEGRTLPDSAQLTNYHVPYWDPNNWGAKAVKHSDLHEENVWDNNHLDKLL